MVHVLIDVPVYEPVMAKLRTDPQLRFTVTPASDASGHAALPAETLGEVDVFLGDLLPADHEQMDRLRWVQLGSAGYEHVLRFDLPRRGVRVTNASGVFDTAIAEWNLAMMVNLRRDLPTMRANQEGGVWDRAAVFQRDIRGATVGLWGYGGLARETARLCKAVGMRVVVLNRSGLRPQRDSYRVAGTGDPDGTLPDAVYTDDQKQAFLADLDFLVMALPLTGQTRGIVGEAELRALPRRAMLLNPARGPLIEEAALLRALRERWIAAAALDAHYHYPMPPDHPLWRMPNVIMTPHIAGSSGSPSYLARLWDLFQQNLERLLTDQPLLNDITAACAAATAA